MAITKKVLNISLYPGYKYGGANTSIANIDIKTQEVTEKDELQKCLDKIKDKSYTPVAKDKLYFYPECVVPRFKVRELWKPKNVAITVKEDNGTHKFLHSDIDKFIEGSGNVYKIKSIVLKEWLNFHSPSFDKYGLSNIKISEWDQEYQDLLDSEEYVYVNWSTYRILDNGDSMIGTLASQGNVSFPTKNYNALPNITTKFNGDTAYFCAFKDDRFAKAFEDLDNDIIDEYYIDDAINRALQDESTVIDEDMYNQLYNLLKSSDENNRIMAMEVMANSNIPKSCNYIYKLMQKFNTEMAYTKAYNSVNFKALRDSTGLQRYTTYNEENYIKFLSKYDAIDVDTVRFIQKDMLKHIENTIANYYGHLIDTGIAQISVPQVRVVLKGVNDGSINFTIIDEHEEELSKDLAENPEAYGIINAVSPCAAHDDCSLQEVLKEEVLMEEIAEMVTKEEEDIEVLVTDPEGTLDILMECMDKAEEKVSIVAPIIEAITPDQDYSFDEGEFSGDPFSDNLVEADDEDLIS